MTINHREKAEELLEVAAKEHILPNGDPTRALAAAQVHATLARDEEQAATTADRRDALYSLRCRFNDTRALVARHIADGLASREKDRWKAALDLSKALDEAHCNVDELVDTRLTDDGWDPQSAYKTPASLVPTDDPWGAKTDITADVPERIRRIITEQLVDMLLAPDEGNHGWARRLAFALKDGGADLTGDIEKRITDLTLGRDPSDPPF